MNWDGGFGIFCRCLPNLGSPFFGSSFIQEALWIKAHQDQGVLCLFTPSYCGLRSLSITKTSFFGQKMRNSVSVVELNSAFLMKTAVEVFFLRSQKFDLEWLEKGGVLEEASLFTHEGAVICTFKRGLKSSRQLEWQWCKSYFRIFF